MILGNSLDGRAEHARLQYNFVVLSAGGASNA